MTWNLVRKELWQHWLAFLIAGLLTFSAGVLLLSSSLVRGHAGTPFEGYRLFVAIFGVILPTVICHRLVVVEYQARTQLFLEGLPFPRWRMLATKYALGLALVLLLLGLGFLASLVVAARHDPPSTRFLAIVSARAASYAWCAWNFFFVMGLLGRYRVAIYLALGLALLGLQEMSALHLTRFGPFALVDATFPYEADRFPWTALRHTWLLGGAFLALAFFLGLVREGSVAALLAEKMSHREKVFISALLVGLLWTVTLVGEKNKRVAFDLPGAAAESAPGVVVKVAPASESDAWRSSARNLARAAATELVSLRDYFEISELPPVFITPRGDLDANRYERGELEHHHGLHVQANFASPNWETRDFLPWLLREVLIVASNDRARHESRRFVLDGFALHWSRRGPSASNTNADAVPLRALYGARNGVTPADLSRWLSFREQVGDPIASAVACSALESLARRCEPARFRAFVRATLALGTPRDLRALLGRGGQPWERALPETTGLPVDRFFSTWQEDLGVQRRELASRLERIPRLSAELHVSRQSNFSRQLAYSIALDPPAGTNATVSFLYHILPPYDEEVDEQLLQREHTTCAATVKREVPGEFSRGQRFFFTGAHQSAELGCQIISGWKRMELP
jgi:hypothetical protein